MPEGDTRYVIVKQKKGRKKFFIQMHGIFSLYANTWALSYSLLRDINFEMNILKVAWN